MIIRAAQAGDRPAMAQLWRSAWQATMPAIDFTARLPWLDTHLITLVASGAEILCATNAAGIVLGFATIDPATGDMDQLAIAPDYFGAGAAVALLTEVKRRAPGRVTLSVNQDNPRAVRFYAREGFRAVGVGTNPGSGLDILHMEWP